MMHRRQFLGALAASATPLAAAGSKPNIVLIFADDLGRADLGCYGGKEIPTPNIDSIARNGTLFSDGYVSCPYCSPTRAGLMTGRYQTHFGHEFNPGPAGEAQENFGLPLTETAMPKRLKDLGYRTGIFGKWHLGYREPYRPLQRGFDEFYGFLGGAHSYLDARRKRGIHDRGVRPAGLRIHRKEQGSELLCVCALQRGACTHAYAAAP
jgi:arylsulfatase A-like enzyme